MIDKHGRPDSAPNPAKPNHSPNVSAVTATTLTWSKKTSNVQTIEQKNEGWGAGNRTVVRLLVPSCLGLGAKDATAGGP